MTKTPPTNYREAYAHALNLAANAKPGMDESSIETILKLTIGMSPFNRNRIIATLAKSIKVSTPRVQAFYRDMDVPKVLTAIDEWEKGVWFMEYIIDGKSHYIYGPEAIIRKAQMSKDFIHVLTQLHKEA